MKAKISLAPNNPSAWNYLRGILECSSTPFISLAPFVEPYTSNKNLWSDEDVVDLDNPKPSSDAVLPCVAALDYLAEAHAREGDDGVGKAVELWKLLANEHDTMRKKYVQRYSSPHLIYSCLYQVLGVSYQGGLEWGCELSSPGGEYMARRMSVHSSLFVGVYLNSQMNPPICIIAAT